jgi:hypothetical protein
LDEDDPYPLLGDRVKNPGHRPGLLPRKKPLGPAAPKPPLAIPPQPQVGASWLFPVNEFLDLETFVPLYHKLGRGAVCPIILSLTTVFQFLENIPDRVTARCAVMSIVGVYCSSSLNCCRRTLPTKERGICSRKHILRGIWDGRSRLWQKAMISSAVA